MGNEEPPFAFFSLYQCRFGLCGSICLGTRKSTPSYCKSTLDGSVWPDGTISACLTKACMRAKIPRLHTSNWRQFAASISKEKFSAKERANFDLEDNLGEDIEDELDLVALAEQSNHSYHTFNHGYAGTTTLTMNTLLHRNHRASESWRTFFRFDYTLQGKRPRGASETLSLRMLDTSKRSQLRRKGAYSEADLLAVAQRLFNDPSVAIPDSQVSGVVFWPLWGHNQPSKWFWF